MADGDDPRTDPDPQWTARRVRASGSSIAFALVTIVAVYLLRDVFVAATQPLGWLAAAAALALVVSPVVGLLARWIPRGLAIVGVYVAGIAVIATLGTGLYVQVQDQLAELAETLPAAAQELEESGSDDGVLAQLEFGSLVQDVVDDVSERLTPDPDIDDAAGAIPAYFVTGILSIFLLIWSARLFDAAGRQISQDDRRERFRRVTSLTVRWAQVHLVGAIGLAVVVGIVGGAVAWLAGLPTPLVLGVVLGVASLIPYLGVLFGAVPMVMVAAAFEPATTAVLVGAAAIVIQAGATMAHRFLIDPPSVRVGPAALVIAVLVGSDMYGVGGALVGVVAAVLSMAAIDARREPDPDDVERAPHDGPGDGHDDRHDLDDAVPQNA